MVHGIGEELGRCPGQPYVFILLLAICLSNSIFVFLAILSTLSDLIHNGEQYELLRQSAVHLMEQRTSLLDRLQYQIINANVLDKLGEPGTLIPEQDVWDQLKDALVEYNVRRKKELAARQEEGPVEQTGLPIVEGFKLGPKDDSEAVPASGSSGTLFLPPPPGDEEGEKDPVGTGALGDGECEAMETKEGNSENANPIDG